MLKNEKGKTHNVKDFGAMGDGEKDDTTAIQDAIDAANADGGIVLLSSGIYKVLELRLS